MEHPNADRILLCLRYGIGDVVMETPVLDALHRRHPRSELTVLGAPPAVELLDRDPRIHRVVSVARWGLDHRWDEGSAEARRAIRRWVDSTPFDLYLDVHQAVAGVRDVIWGRGIPTVESDPGAEAAAVARGADGVAAIKEAVRCGWGLEVSADRLPHLHLLASDRRFADRFLARHGVGAAPVGLAPVASLPMKRWPTERFGAVLDWVVEHTGRPVILFTGPQRSAGEAVRGAGRHGDRVVVVGALHLRRVAALLERCAAFVCNDTGLMHMAAAVGTPTVAVFGPTSPRIYAPPAPHATAVGGRDIACPYRNTASLEPPGCWTSDRCLIAAHSCSWKVGVEEVTTRLQTILELHAERCA